jgi:hypothetical protein
METVTQREQFVAKLLTGPVDVVFTKVDGSARRMTATLKPDLIPNNKTPDDATKSRKVNEEVIPCFDLELQDWRSFRVDSVIDFVPVQ